MNSLILWTAMEPRAFDLIYAGNRFCQDGEVRFELLPNGDKIIETVELQALED